MAPRRARGRGRGRGKHCTVSSSQSQSSLPVSQALMLDTLSLPQPPYVGDRDLLSQYDGTRTWTSSSDSVQFEDTYSHRIQSSVASVKSKRGRGPSKGVGLKMHVHHFGKINVEISPETVRPIDSEVAIKLPRECTRIVRTHAPIKNKKGWKDIEESEKEPLYAQLQKSFNIKDMDAPHVLRCIEEYFANTYRRFRTYCHTHYLQVKKSGADPRQHLYRGVRQEDWEFLCDHFETESFKKRSIANKSNRGKSEFSHCMGPKLFVTVLNEKKESSNTTEQIGRIDFFARTRISQKTGKFCSPAAQAKYEKMKELLKKVKEGESPLTQDEIYDEVMGRKSGYVKGLGQGPKPMKQKSQNIAFLRETRALRKKVAAQDELIKSLQRKKEEQAQQLEEMHAQGELIKSLQWEKGQQAQRLEEMRRQVELINSFKREKVEQAEHLEEMRASQAQLEEQAKQLEEMRKHHAQLEASFQQIMQRCVTFGGMA